MPETLSIPAEEDPRCTNSLSLSSSRLPSPLPALAQKKEEPKKEAAKVAIPTNTFFKGQTASQYLAKERLLGAKVVNKDGQTVGTVDDLIVGPAARSKA